MGILLIETFFPFFEELAEYKKGNNCDRRKCIKLFIIVYCNGFVFQNDFYLSLSDDSCCSR